MRYLYLHGLGSGPNSAKAKYFAARFRSRGIELELLDFNLDSAGAFDFVGLSLTRNIAKVKQAIAQGTEPVTLIGSSLGGLTAAWAAQDSAQVERLVLLAPAFDFLNAWLPALGEEQVGQWKTTGQLEYFHYGQGNQQSLGYGFVTDLASYDEVELGRFRRKLALQSLPTLILHGSNDETVPISASRAYAASRDWVKLIELDSDHGLGNSVSRIWREIQEFCPLG